jgi:hypothetical protein
MIMIQQCLKNTYSAIIGMYFLWGVKCGQKTIQNTKVKRVFKFVAHA